MKLVSRSAACAALCFCGACSFGPSSTQKAEAGRISRAIDLLREAPNAKKPELFAALEKEPCETQDLCELKRSCLAGYAEHLSGLQQTANAKAALADGGSDTEIATLLETAKVALSHAKPDIARCADAQGAAQRKYKP